jgi:hypothetical protein
VNQTWFDPLFRLWGVERDIEFTWVGRDIEYAWSSTPMHVAAARNDDPQTFMPKPEACHLQLNSLKGVHMAAF